MKLDKDWYKISEVADLGLILNSKGKKDVRYIYRIIKEGRLKATAKFKGHWREYLMISKDEVIRYRADNP